MIMQAIETRYLGRSSRIKATAWGGSVTVAYDHALDAPQNHAAAARALLAKLGWSGTFVQGGGASGSGYVFVDIGGRQLHSPVGEAA